MFFFQAVMRRTGVMAAVAGVQHDGAHRPGERGHVSTGRADQRRLAGRRQGLGRTARKAQHTEGKTDVAMVRQVGRSVRKGHGQPTIATRATMK